MVYVTATKEDLSSLIQLRISYLESEFGSLARQEQDDLSAKLEAYFKQHLNKDLYVYLAKLNNVIVATAYLLIMEKPASPSFPTGRIGQILSVYTMPVYRRKGVATKLLNNLLQEAKKKQLSYIELAATKDGYLLYKKLGFKEYVSPYTQMRYYIDDRK